MKKYWKYISQASENQIESLAEQINIRPELANLLIQRNVQTFEEAKLFFRPSIDHLHDPFLMQDMDVAVDRLKKAMENKERILVYGDYDVDGTTSVALVYSFLREIYTELDFYVPDRYSEGYGISLQGIDYAKETNVSLVIALDCGIKAIDKIEYANKKNIDFIICDHHTVGETIPDAVAVLDPKRLDCNYPYKELSGCGVGFKFLQAFSQRNDIQFELLQKYIDLVAVSIASDIVPLTGENRTLAYFGLKKLNSHPLVGLHTLIKLSGAGGKKFTISDSVFKIGPRINAAGRVEKASKSVELLIEQDVRKAKEFGKLIDEYNSTRKALDESITAEALAMLNDNELELDKKSTVVYKEEWHKGVIGIVASRLIEKYYRPTIVLTKSNGKATGSGRSVEGFNLYNAIDSCSDLLSGFGGHKYAAGLTMDIEHIPEFKTRFNQFVNEHITDEQLIPRITIDALINFEAITPKFYRVLNQFAPFGPENLSPIFVTENVRDAGNSRRVGEEGRHLSLDLISENGVKIRGIAFSMAEFYDDVVSGKPFDICYSIQENIYKEKKTLQLFIKDIKVH